MQGTPFSATGLLLVVTLHAAAVSLLLSLNVVRLPPETAVLMIRTIQPETPELPPEPPPPPPPRPKPAPRQAPLQPEPQAQPAPEPAQAPLPRIVAAETSAPSAASEPPAFKAPPAPAPAPASTPLLTPPGFDADYLDNPAPLYPAMSRRLEESGKTILRVYVEADGKPSQIQIKTGSGSPRLDQAAQDAIWRWKFVPARRGNEAIGAWVLVPIVFNLKG